MKYIDEIKFPKPSGFTDKYATIRDKFLLKRTEENPADKPPVTKKLLKTIWSEQRIERRGLRTSSGDSICVLCPGNWNFDVGPDFKNAKIIINNKEIAGDIVTDLFFSDWIKFDRGKDPLLKNAVLFVIAWKNTKEDIITDSLGKKIPCLELSSCANNEIDRYNAEFDVENYPGGEGKHRGRCASYNPDKYSLLEHLVAVAGDERVRIKSGVFSEELRERSIADIIYRGLMDGLGYGANRANFRKLADMLPLERIEDVIRAEKFEEKSLRIQSLVLGVSGLIPAIERVNAIDNESEEYISKVRKIWKIIRKDISASEVLKKDSWKFKGLRPFNFPYRRIAALSIILSKYDACGLEKLFNDFLKEVMEGRFSAASFRKKLMCENSGNADYWKRRVSFNARKMASDVSYLGDERTGSIIINTFIPLALALNDDRTKERKLFDFWARIPSRSINSITLCTSTKIGFGKIIKNERTQQGLLQIFRDFCDTKKGTCRECGFPALFTVPVRNFFA